MMLCNCIVFELVMRFWIVSEKLVAERNFGIYSAILLRFYCAKNYAQQPHQ